jgi:hypothetical protein
VVERLKKDRERLLADPGQRWKFEDRLIRSLVRLKRFDEARRELQLTEKRMGRNALLRAVIAAASGDVAATEEYLRSIRNQPFTLQSCYGDPDLGPALQGEAFRKLREKYPAPE